MKYNKIKIQKERKIDPRLKWIPATAIVAEFRVCPKCGDAKGHCGYYEFEDGSIREYCVKCEHKHIFKTSSKKLYHDDVKVVSQDYYNMINKIENIYPYSIRTEDELAFFEWAKSRGFNDEFSEYLFGRRYFYMQSPLFNSALKNSPVISIPVYDISERIVGVRYRMINPGKHGKYLWDRNYKTKPTPFYTFVRGSKPKIETIYIVEGEFKAEFISWTSGQAALGIIGLGNLKNKKIAAILEKFKDLKQVIYVPDRDVFTQWHKYEMIMKEMFYLQKRIYGLNVDVLYWPFYEIEKNGFDDYLLSLQKGEKPLTSKFNIEELATPLKEEVEKQVDILLKKDDTFKFIKNKEGTSLFEVIKPEISTSSTYTGESRIELWRQALLKRKFVLDVSGTGSGKSHTTAIDLKKVVEKGGFKVIPKKMTREDGTEVEYLSTPFKIFYVSQSPINPTIDKFDEWFLYRGRTPNGHWYSETLEKWEEAPSPDKAHEDYPPTCLNPDLYTIREDTNSNLFTNNYCDLFCPMKENCNYIAQKREMMDRETKFVRISYKSLPLMDETLVIIDESIIFSHLEHIEINLNHLAQLNYAAHSAKELLRHVIVLNNSHMFDEELNKTLLEEEVESTVKFFELFSLFLNSANFGKLQAKKNATFKEVHDAFADFLVENELTPLEKLINPYFDFDFEKMEKLLESLFILGNAIKQNKNGKLPREARKAKRWLEKNNVNYYGVLNNVENYHELLRIMYAIKSMGRNGSVYVANKKLFVVVPDLKTLSLLQKVKDGKIYLIILEATPNNPTIEYITKFLNPVTVGDYTIPKNLTLIKTKGLGKMTFKPTKKKSEKRLEYIKEFHEKRFGDKKKGIITSQKEIILMHDEFKKEFVKYGYWFKDDRGSNKFQDVEVLYLQTPPIRNLATVSGEIIASNYSLEGESTFILNQVEKELSNTYVQAVGRLRAHRRANKDLYVVFTDDIPLPFSVDEEIEIGDYVDKLKKGNNVIERLNKEKHKQALLRIGELYRFFDFVYRRFIPTKTIVKFAAKKFEMKEDYVQRVWSEYLKKVQPVPKITNEEEIEAFRKDFQHIPITTSSLGFAKTFLLSKLLLDNFMDSPDKGKFWQRLGLNPKKSDYNKGVIRRMLKHFNFEEEDPDAILKSIEKSFGSEIIEHIDKLTEEYEKTLNMIEEHKENMQIDRFKLLKKEMPKLEKWFSDDKMPDASFKTTGPDGKPVYIVRNPTDMYRVMNFILRFVNSGKRLKMMVDKFYKEAPKEKGVKPFSWKDRQILHMYIDVETYKPNDGKFSKPKVFMTEEEIEALPTDDVMVRTITLRIPFLDNATFVFDIEKSDPIANGALDTYYHPMNSTDVRFHLQHYDEYKANKEFLMSKRAEYLKERTELLEKIKRQGVPFQRLKELDEKYNGKDT